MSKITKSAKGEQCQVRLQFVCNGDPETVVLAHIGGAGMGMKQPDTEAAYCCSACHDVLDGRVKTKISVAMLKLFHHEGAMRTRKKLIDKGLILIVE